MNYRHLNVEVGPLFRRSLKFRPAPVGVRVRFESSDPIAAGDGPGQDRSQVGTQHLAGQILLVEIIVGPRPQVLWEAKAYDEWAKKRRALRK